MTPASRFTIPRLRELPRVFLSPRGRISRSTFWGATLGGGVTFGLLFLVLDGLLGRTSTLVLYPLFYWSMFVLAAKRYHDLGKRAWGLVLVLLPIVGPLWLAIGLGLRRGTRGDNRFGPDSLEAPGPAELTA
jgi:uncharacterized membrane protein YhaH (DUF805 family)